jgi:hypothetical protein
MITKNLNVSSGVSYEYLRGKYAPMVGIKALIPLIPLIQITIGADYIFTDTNIIASQAGIRFQLRGTRKWDKRFF